MDDIQFTGVVLHVPFGGLIYLESKLNEYASGPLGRRGTPPHAFLSNLNRISVAAVEALWTESEPLPRDDVPYWWEFWIRRQPEDVWISFQTLIGQLGSETRGIPLRLPDHIVVIVQAQR